jgi:hypothetical protein
VPAVVALVVVLRTRRQASVPIPALSGILIGTTVGIGLAVMVAHHGAATGIDVYISHGEAAQILVDGGNPYSEDLVIFDGRPDAVSGEEIIGYSYPPVTMLSYAGAHLLVGDSRWLNLVAWTAVLSVLALHAVRRREAAAFAALLVAASFGTWRLVVFTGWTEPLTILLLLIAGVFWEKNGFLAAIALGLALGTKQYLILLAPLLLVAAPKLGIKRTLGALGVAAASVAPFLILWGDSMVEALVLRFLDAGYRSDTLSIPAIVDAFGGSPRHYVVLGLVLVLVLSWFAGQRVDGYALLMTGSAVVLAAFFVVTQALSNYWFLVAACCVLASWRAAGEPPSDMVHTSATGDGAT